LNRLSKYLPPVSASLVFLIVMAVIWPYYRFYVDTDATAYLAIAERYANGDYLSAINGYWSPWSCWLTAWLIKCGNLPMPAAVLANTIGAICFLFVAHSFFLFFNISNKLKWLQNFTLAFFLCFAIFWQLFDDIWECFFLLLVLRIMVRPDFRDRKDLWIWAGITGGFAYYAKAYAFPFFILNMLCCGFYITQAWKKENRIQWVKLCAVSILAMLVIAFPWIWLLHEKYGIWTTSTAGTLNLSWYTVGHPFWKEGIQYIIPPPYPDSPSYWEDPWIANGATPHFWDSPKMLLRQIARIAYNVLLFVKSLNELSPFMLPITGTALVIVFSKHVRQVLGERTFIIALSFLIFPLGFFLINFESRYLWYMLVPGMIMVALAVQILFARINDGKYLKTILPLLFMFSFLAWPMLQMKKMYKDGERGYKISQDFKKIGIKGSFTANVVFGDGNAVEEVSRYAYFSGNAYYNMPYLNIPYDSLLHEMRRYKVKYYLYYSRLAPGIDTFVLRDEQGNPFREVTQEKGVLKIFEINP
jgi:hypothetical protein